MAGFHPGIKFTFVALCFVVALVSFLRSYSRRDWFWLTAGMGFTVAADYFLVLHDRHLIGITIFCFAHICYILRAIDVRLQSWPALVFLMSGIFIVVLARSVYVIAAVYATLFAINIIVNGLHLRQKKARLPKHNRVLVLTGLILFMLCDICVLLYNLPTYYGASIQWRQVLPLVWVFYLPSQVLLALSGVRFKCIHT